MNTAHYDFVLFSKVYAPASGPAFADSRASGSNSIPHEQGDIEAAVASGAAAFGVPRVSCYTGGSLTSC